MYVDELQNGEYLDLVDYVITSDPLQWVIRSAKEVDMSSKFAKEENEGRRILGEPRYYSTIDGIINYLKTEVIFNSIHGVDDMAEFVNSLKEYQKQIDEYRNEIKQFDWNKFKILKDSQTKTIQRDAIKEFVKLLGDSGHFYVVDDIVDELIKEMLE